MPSLSDLVCQELQRYSKKLDEVLASLEQRGPIRTIDDLSNVLSKIHSLSEDDFLDRLEPAGWIQPLLETSLVPHSARLIDHILQTYNDAKDAGLFLAGAVAEHQIKRHVWAQLAAAEIGHAAFPIQSAVQAIQLEAASTPARQRQGGCLLVQLTAGPVLYVLADASRFVQEELWCDGSEAAEAAAEAATEPASAASTVNPDATAPQPSSQHRKSILGGLRRHLDNALGEFAGSSSNSVGGNGGSSGSSASSGFGSSAAAATAGAQVLSFIAHHLSAALAALEAESETNHGGTAEPAVAKLLAGLKDSGVLTALCAAVVSAPPGAAATGDAVAAAARATDNYSAIVADVQLTTCMALWDLSALVGTHLAAVGELLEAPAVLQLRRTALEQVAASACASSLSWRAGYRHISDYPAGSGGGGGSAGGGRSGGGGWAGRGGGRSGGGGAATAVAARPARACWPLLQCPAVQRVYAARGLQLPDVIHILVDAAVGAVNMTQDHGTAAAITAAQRLFPSRAAAAELAARVCRALYGHAAEGTDLASAVSRGGGSPWATPYMSSGGGGSRMSSRGGGGGSRSCSRGGGGGLPQQQRAQLADDAASVEVALRIRMLGAPPEELATCMPAVIGVRSWVQRLSVAVYGNTAAAIAAAAAAASPGFLTLAVEEDSPAPSELSSLSSPDGTAGVYDNDASPGYPFSTFRHEDHPTSPEDSGPCSSPSTDSLENPATVGAAAAAADMAMSSSPTGSSDSIASRAGSRSAPTMPESETSLAGSRSGSKSRSLWHRASAGSHGPLSAACEPGVSPSPRQSPIRRQLSAGSGLRRSLDRLKRLVLVRRSHEELARSADFATAEKVVLPPRAQTPGRQRVQVASTDQAAVSQLSQRQNPSATLASPPHHHQQQACVAQYSSQPQPQQPFLRPIPHGTPPRAQPPRYASAAGAPVAAPPQPLSTPPRALRSAGGSAGYDRSQSAHAASPTAHAASMAAAADGPGRGLAARSPSAARSAGGVLLGRNSSGGSGRYSSSGGPPGPTSRPAVAVAAAVDAAAVGGGIGRGRMPLASEAAASAAPAAAAARRSMLRSSVLAAPLRLLQRAQPRVVQGNGAEGK